MSFILFVLVTSYYCFSFIIDIYSQRIYSFFFAFPARYKRINEQSSFFLNHLTVIDLRFHIHYSIFMESSHQPFCSL